MKRGKYKIPAYSYLRFQPYKKGRKIETFFLGSGVGKKNDEGETGLVADIDMKTKKLVGIENLIPFTLEIE